MPAIDFPNSPSVNQTFFSAGITWVWTGTVWNIVSESNIVTGPFESVYRFDLGTIWDQDVHVSTTTTLTYIFKTPGISTVSYQKNGGGYTLLSFSANVWTGTINLVAGDSVDWQITYNVGYVTGCLIVKGTRT